MRILQGIVTSLKMPKTVTVTVTRYKKHSKYHKRFRVTRKYHAHYEGNDLQLGDTAYILESKPISKLKRWILVSPDERKNLVAEYQAEKTKSDKVTKDIKAITDIQETSFETKKRKMSSNKRNKLAESKKEAGAKEAKEVEATETEKSATEPREEAKEDSQTEAPKEDPKTETKNPAESENAQDEEKENSKKAEKEPNQNAKKDDKENNEAKG